MKSVIMKHNYRGTRLTAGAAREVKEWYAADLKTFLARRSREPADLTKARTDLPRPVAHLLERMLAPDSEQRLMEISLLHGLLTPAR